MADLLGTGASPNESLVWNLIKVIDLSQSLNKNDNIFCTLQLHKEPQMSPQELWETEKQATNEYNRERPYYVENI